MAVAPLCALVSYFVVTRAQQRHAIVQTNAHHASSSALFVVNIPNAQRNAKSLARHVFKIVLGGVPVRRSWSASPFVVVLVFDYLVIRAAISC